MTGGTTHKLRPSPYLLQVTSQTLFFPVRNYSPHTFRSKRTPESHNLTEGFLESVTVSNLLTDCLPIINIKYKMLNWIVNLILVPRTLRVLRRQKERVGDSLLFYKFCTLLIHIENNKTTWKGIWLLVAMPFFCFLCCPVIYL